VIRALVIVIALGMGLATATASAAPPPCNGCLTPADASLQPSTDPSLQPPLPKPAGPPVVLQRPQDLPAVQPTSPQLGAAPPQASANCDAVPHIPCAPTVAVPGKDAPTATSRYESFFGPIKQGQFDAWRVNLWYLEDTADVNLGITSIDTGIPKSSTVWGMVADGEFTFYKTVVHESLKLVGWAVFGLALVVSLIDPALQIGYGFQRSIFDVYEPAQFILGIVSLFMVWLWLVGQRLGQAIVEGIMSVFIGTIALMVLPVAEMARWFMSLFISGSAAILVAVAGGDASKVPGPSTGPIDTGVLTGAYNGFSRTIEETMIGRVAEVTTFSRELPAACKGAYDQGLSLQLQVTDPKNFDAMKAIGACRQFVEQGQVADSGRAGIGAMLLLFSLAFGGILIFWAWKGMAGQIKFLVLLTANKFLLFGMMLPGTARTAVALFALRLALGCLPLLTLAFYLGLMLVFMAAILTATPGWSVATQLLVVLAVPFGLALVGRRVRKEGQARMREVDQTRTGRAKAGRNSQRHFYFRNGRPRLMSPAGVATVAAASGVAGAAAVVGRQGARVARAATSGVGGKSGIVSSPKRNAEPQEEVPPRETGARETGGTVSRETSDRQGGARTSAPREPRRETRRDRIANGLLWRGTKVAHSGVERVISRPYDRVVGDTATAARRAGWELSNSQAGRASRQAAHFAAHTASTGAGRAAGVAHRANEARRSQEVRLRLGASGVSDSLRGNAQRAARVRSVDAEARRQLDPNQGTPYRRSRR
jgi:hypothetical protein